jgi:hypothetical protein
MGQHYTLQTVETSAWCNKCSKNTPHRVAGKRLSFCIPCWERSKAESEAEKAKPKQPEQVSLFGEKS